MIEQGQFGLKNLNKPSMAAEKIAKWWQEVAITITLVHFLFLFLEHWSLNSGPHA
jgi:hypothetical protein